ncbi:MAG: CDP-diacylglycerol--glycerol-3-phosphate 3-phosphatidyltransferase [Bacteriovoracaceae bacterium]|nr:CDP-diacylglycerol--glycerol-3-phosphate 3-phosphatidyltransferase [Bacteriovoracaceae bacterium]
MWKTILPVVSTPKPAADQIDAGRLKGSPFLSQTIVTWWVREFMKPIEDVCVKYRITPNKITTIGFVLTLFAASLLATKHLVLGGWMVIIAGCFDFFDGRVARRMNLSTISGAFYDSVLDRYMDSAVLFALAYYFRASWFLPVIYLAILGSATTPYIRAKSESLGIESSGGAMQRPERIVFIGLGSAFSGYLMILFYPFQKAGEEMPPYLLMVSLCIVALMSNKVALQRCISTFKLLKSKES